MRRLEATGNRLSSRFLGLLVAAAVLLPAATYAADSGATGPTATPISGRHPTRGTTLGAQVRMVIFTDFQCPFCARSAGFVDKLYRKHHGALQIVLANYPLSFHKRARPAAIAALAAWAQGRFWPMHDALFAGQDDLGDGAIRKMARRLKLDMKRFVRDLRDPSLAKMVDRDRGLGRKLGVQGTPNFFINGVEVPGMGSFKIFDQLISLERKAAIKAGRDGAKWLEERTRMRKPELADLLYREHK